LLLGTSAVAGAIVKGNPQAIPNILTTGTSEGMFTFAAHLADLLARKEITAPVAVMQSPNPRDTLDFLVQRNAVTPADANLLRKNYALV
jgi:Tfp pilus assembly pilus retraction ATPase PilT